MKILFITSLKLLIYMNYQCFYESVCNLLVVTKPKLWRPMIYEVYVSTLLKSLKYKNFKLE